MVAKGITKATIPSLRKYKLDAPRKEIGGKILVGGATLPPAQMPRALHSFRKPLLASFQEHMTLRLTKAGSLLMT